MTHTSATIPRRRRRLLALLFALALLASACGTDDDTASDLADDARSLDRGEETSDSVEAGGDAESDLDDAEGSMVDGDEAEEEGADLESDGESRFAPAPTPGLAAPPDVRGSADAIDGLTLDGVARAEASEEPTLGLADGAGEDDAEGLFAPPAIQPPDLEEPANPRLEDNRFTDYGYRRFIATDADPFSTFALDVDTGSYTVTRRWLDEGVAPPPAAVRVEELVNFFDYDYEVPRRGLEISVDGGPSPFDEDNLLVRIGVQAEVIADTERPPVNLTFIVDTSGSMDRDDRLGLVKDSLELLIGELHDDDTVAIVVYSDRSGTVLEPTRVSESRRIREAIDSLRPGGSTNLESGLREGYALAASAFRRDGINRVIIASDGVANAGITDEVELSRFIRGYADEGIQLVTVGYGMGNFNDTLMEQLADNGDGFYAYVDTEDEAERLFQDELTSTLVTAAIDAKIQVEFDTDIVDEYRLIGFENRGVLDSEFRNDRVDAGELGAGHQVTAMYEVTLRRGVSLDDRGDIGEVFLRWQDPASGEVIEIDEDIDLRDVEPDWNDTALDFQLATVVTAFAEVLRDNPYADDVRLSNLHVEAGRVADRLDDDKVDELVDLLAIALDLYW